MDVPYWTGKSCTSLLNPPSFNANADTTSVKLHKIVEVKKKGEHCEQDPNCFNRYHPAIKPVARAAPGDHIVVHTRDALDSKLNINSNRKMSRRLILI
jgi:formamidase